MYAFIFFFNATATTEIYTLSLHDALPIFWYFGSHNRGHVEIDATSEKLGDLDRFWNIVPDLTAGRRTGDILPPSREHFNFEPGRSAVQQLSSRKSARRRLVRRIRGKRLASHSGHGSHRSPVRTRY